MTDHILRTKLLHAAELLKALAVSAKHPELHEIVETGAARVACDLIALADPTYKFPQTPAPAPVSIQPKPIPKEPEPSVAEPVKVAPMQAPAQEIALAAPVISFGTYMTDETKSLAAASAKAVGLVVDPAPALPVTARVHVPDPPKRVEKPEAAKPVITVSPYAKPVVDAVARAGGTPRRAGRAFIQQWADQRGIGNSGRFDLDQVNAKARKLGLPPFEIEGQK